MAPYYPSTSGFYATQIAFGGDGAGDGIFTRRGSQTTWGAWREFIIKDTSGNISPNGVYLGGTSSTNLLDYYQEGTWSPVLGWTGGGNYSMVGITSGEWTRIGNMVFVNCELSWSGFSGSSAGELRVSGLPFASASFSRQAGSISAVSSGLTFSTVNYTQWTITIDAAQSQFYIIQQGSTYSHQPVVGNSGTIYSISLAYKTS
tara:strand:- start:72 stop:680 length:609 start_codon:yes stop_codon:yes gene_type:complete